MRAHLPCAAGVAPIGPTIAIGPPFATPSATIKKTFHSPLHPSLLQQPVECVNERLLVGDDVVALLYLLLQGLQSFLAALCFILCLLRSSCNQRRLCSSARRLDAAALFAPPGSSPVHFNDEYGM